MSGRSVRFEKHGQKRERGANETKGQGQLVGANGQFGVVYTLDNNFNFEILSAKYTMDPLIAYESPAAKEGPALFLQVRCDTSWAAGRFRM